MRKVDELDHGCMAKADEREMTFVLLGRDPAAPAAIRAWAAERVRLRMNTASDEKLAEAEACAATMQSECANAAAAIQQADDACVVCRPWLSTVLPPPSLDYFPGWFGSGNGRLGQIIWQETRGQLIVLLHGRSLPDDTTRGELRRLAGAMGITLSGGG